MTRGRTASKYMVFAVFAVLANLSTQWISFRLYHGPGELISGMAAGTAVGLATKYVLDKIWIFQDRSFGFVANVHKFGFYVLTGIITTAVFWGTEIIFGLIGNELMRYVGGGIGLAIGYVMKFHLDRRYVFRSSS